MGKSKTHEEYVAELLEKRGDEFEVIENYETNAKKIMHRCRKCSYEWTVRPINLLRGQGCPGCRNKSLSKERKKTKEQYVAEVLKVHGDNIKVLGTYNGARNTTDHQCNTCKNIWSAAPTNILKGRGCPKCVGKDKTQDEYIKEVFEVHGDSVQVIGMYKAAHKKIEHQCNECGHIWETMPTGILRGRGCPICGGKMKRTHERYVSEVFEVHGDKVEVIGTYVNAKTKITHRCKAYGHQWDAVPLNVVNKGSACAKCKESTGEKLVTEILELHNVLFDTQVSFGDMGFKKYTRLRPDFVLYSNEKPTLVIEYNGIQHYRPVDIFDGEEGFKATVKRDNIKRGMLKEAGIHILEIPYYKTDVEVREMIEAAIERFGIEKEHDFTDQQKRLMQL